MPDPLDPRLLRLLQAVVEEHVKTAQPVGSQTLVERQGLGVSSATVRNWLGELEQAGYVVQPHTSGGRIPTEAGYRCYVGAAPAAKPLPKKQEQALRAAAQTSVDAAPRAKALARALADLMELAAFVRFQGFDCYYTGLSQLFAQPEFRDWQQVVSLSEVLDRLDEALQALPPVQPRAPCLLIGGDSPFGSACSTAYIGHGGAVIGILGPLRMDYLQARAALQATAALLPALA